MTMVNHYIVTVGDPVKKLLLLFVGGMVVLNLLPGVSADVIQQMGTLTTKAETAIERLAEKATAAMSSEQRCYVIQGGLSNPDESDVICSMPNCGEKFSESLPEFITSSMWGTTGRTQGATCTEELGHSPATCGYCKGINLYFDKPSVRAPRGFATQCTATNQLDRDPNCQVR